MLDLPPTLTSGNLKLIKDKFRKNGVHAISFFNNKGGVGKTTLVANLAAQMSLMLDFKILVVDADPQCNLTQYMLTDEEFISAYEGKVEPQSIYSVIHPLSIGRGYSENLPVRSVENFGCDLIIGDPRLALKEDLLAQDWRDARAGGTRGLRTTFVFADLIKKAKAKYDFIFFDMGPSLGAINRSVLLAANYFVVPMSIDIFSLWAIKNIAEAINIWERDLANGLRLAEDPGELPVRKSEASIRFLGYVTQQHKETRKKGNTRVVEAYETIRRRLPDEVKLRLFSLFSSPKMSPHLGDIKHLSSLAPKSQTLHRPMLTLSVRGSYTSLRKEARKIYNDISAVFLENLLASIDN